MPSDPKAMSNSTRKTGSQFLTRKSALAIARQNMTKFRDFLIVEDTPLDADRLKATLHSIFGYDITVRHAATLGSALDRVIDRAPDLVFLDDHLKPSDTAAQTIPLLRRCNYAGHIIVVSGMLDRRRAALLKEAGASLSIHKDNLDSGSIAEALAEVYEQAPSLGANPDVENDGAPARAAPGTEPETEPAATAPAKSAPATKAAKPDTLSTKSARKPKSKSRQP